MRRKQDFLYGGLRQLIRPTRANTPLIADVFSDVLSDKALKSDQIHANAKGYAVVSDELREKLKELGFLH